MKHTGLSLLILLSMSLSLGCYSGNLNEPGNVELHMGQATRSAKERMIADPTAGQRNTAPVEGIAAPTAEDVIDNYHRNEKAEVQERKVRDRELRFDQ